MMYRIKNDHCKTHFKNELLKLFSTIRENFPRKAFKFRAESGYRVAVKKYTMTLLEVMIVIFIIGIIGSVVGYNMRGSLDQGKAFKTKEAVNKLYEIVQLEEAKGFSLSKDSSTPYEDARQILIGSNLVRRASDLLKDGWGNELQFEYDDDAHEWHVRSEKYEAYCEKKNVSTEYPWEEDA